MDVAEVAADARAGARVGGDLGNIHADEKGVAAGLITAPDLALEGVSSVLGRSVLVHPVSYSHLTRTTTPDVSHQAHAGALRNRPQTRNTYKVYRTDPAV
ncbi:superoxide dismutase family protein [Burkholderia pseudomallei]|uniref:superoxide dismutase family protein n=1 Tax=Burkholderia pseudomallei TaxID=28450 RepID=UPI003F686C78